MANIKNFGLIGTGSKVQYGKSGGHLEFSGGQFIITDTDSVTNVALSASGLTATTGNVSISAGSLVLNDTSLSRQSSGVLQFDGSDAFIAPIGNTAARPTASTGMVRVNNDIPLASTIEFYNGTAWTTLATGGSTGAIQAEIDNIETTLGPAITSTGTLDNTQFDAPIVSATSFTDAINQLAAYASSKDTLDEIFPSTANGNVIYSASGVWVQDVPGSASNVQEYSNFLTTASALDGVSVGLVVIDTNGDAQARTILGTTNNIVVTNGNGDTANPVINLASVSQAASGDFVKVTLDSFGRVTGNTAVVSADITALVDGVYVNSSGDTMSGNLAMGGNSVTGLATPTGDTDATNKAYVDALVQGLSWKQAVVAATTADITLSGAQTIDGVSIVDGNRVLVKDQTDQTENGIYVAHAGSWVRSTDTDTGAELDSASVYVEQGTTQADSGWTQTTSNVIIGVSNIIWSQFSGSNSYVGGVGIDITGNTISVNLGAGIAQLPTDEVGIDLWAPSTGALILTGDGSTRSTATGDKLFLLLDGAGALAQTSAGLKINAASVSNAMLVNPAINLAADTGSDSVALGQTLTVSGTSGQGIVTSLTGQTVTITASNATTTTKGVASFDSASFSVTTGAVSLNTVNVAHGGTGATSFTANELIYGNGTSPLAHDPALTFVPSGTDGVLQIGGIGGGALSTYTDSNSDQTFVKLATLGVVGNESIVLQHSDNGSVIISTPGNVGGTISGPSSQPLLVNGSTGLTLASDSGAVTFSLSGTSAGVVSISGVSAASYAGFINDNDLTNKYYVDTAIAAAGTSAGTVKAYKAVVNLGINGTTTIGANLPAGATVLQIKVKVTSASGTATVLRVGTGAVADRYALATDIDASTTGIYVIENFDTDAGAVQVLATVTSTTGAGSAIVLVEYELAE